MKIIRPDTKFCQLLSVWINNIDNATIVFASKCSHKNARHLTNNVGCVWVFTILRGIYSSQYHQVYLTQTPLRQ